MGTCSLGVGYQTSTGLPTTSKQETTFGCSWVLLAGEKDITAVTAHFSTMASLGLQHSNSGIRQPGHGQGLRNRICPAAVCGACKRPISQSQALHTFSVTVHPSIRFGPKIKKFPQAWHDPSRTLLLSKQCHSSEGLPCSIPNCLPKPFATLVKAARTSDGNVCTVLHQTTDTGPFFGEFGEHIYPLVT